jgi:hypothetical protein
MLKDSFPPPKKSYPSPFSLRLNRQERDELQRLAEGRPLGQFIRDAIFTHGLRPNPSRKPAIADHKLFAQLLGAIGQSRIASNINQLAKAANSGSLPVNHEVLEGLNEAVEAIRWMRETLIKAMGLKPVGSPEMPSAEGRHDP